MKKIIVLLIIGMILAGCQSNDSSINNQDSNRINSTHEQISDNVEEQNETMEMIMTINNQDFVVLLDKNETTEALVKQLPMTITMEDLNSNEKYYYTENSFPTDAQSIGKIEAGDFMLFGDDCLVLFYENFSTSYTYTRLGKIEDVENFLKLINQEDSIDVTLHQ